MPRPRPGHFFVGGRFSSVGGGAAHDRIPVLLRWSDASGSPLRNGKPGAPCPRARPGLLRVGRYFFPAERCLTSSAIDPAVCCGGVFGFFGLRGSRLPPWFFLPI